MTGMPVLLAPGLKHKVIWPSVAEAAAVPEKLEALAATKEPPPPPP